MIALIALALAPSHAPPSASPVPLDQSIELVWEARTDADLEGDERFADVTVAGDTAYAAGSAGIASRDLVVAAAAVGSGQADWIRRIELVPGASEEGLSIAVVGDRVLVGGRIRAETAGTWKGFVVGLDAGDGSVLWMLETGPDADPLGTAEFDTRVLQLEATPTGLVLALSRTDALVLPQGVSPPPERLLALDPAGGLVVWEQTPTANEAVSFDLAQSGDRLALIGLHRVPDLFGSTLTDIVVELRSVADGSLIWSRVVPDSVGVFGDKNATDVALSADATRVVGTTNEGGPDVFALAAADGTVQWVVSHPSLGVERLRFDAQGEVVTAGISGERGVVARWASADGQLLGSGLGPEAVSVSALELDGGSGLAVVGFRDEAAGAPDSWIVQGWVPGQAAASWTVQEGLADGLEDEVFDLALDGGSGDCVVAGRRGSADQSGRAWSETRSVAGGASLSVLTYDETFSGADQTVLGLELSDADGEFCLSAGSRGALETVGLPSFPQPSFAANGAWAAAHAVEDGSELWRTMLQGGAKDAVAMAVGGGRLLVGGRHATGHGYVSAVDAGTGSELWSVQVQEFAEDYELVNSLVAVPATDRVLATTHTALEAALVVLDGASGAKVFSHVEDNVDGFEDPSVQVSSDGTRAYFVTSTYVQSGSLGDAQVTCIDLSTGAVVWKNQFDWDGVHESWDYDWVADGALSASDGELFLLVDTNSSPTFAFEATFVVRIDTASGLADWYALYETGAGGKIQPRRLVISPDGNSLYGFSQRLNLSNVIDTVFVQRYDASTGALAWSSSLFTGASNGLDEHDFLVSRDGTQVILAGRTGAAYPDADGLTASWDAASGALLWTSVLEGAGPLDERTTGLAVTPDGRHLLTASQSSEDPSHRDLVLQSSELPALTALPAEISLSAGGTQTFQLSGGTALAGDLGFLVGSLSGTAPGLSLAPGVVLELVPDAYTTYCVTSPNQPPLLGTFGVLDEAGHAQAQLVVPPGTDPGLAGVVAHHAWVGIDPAAGVVFASEPAALSFVP